MYSTFEYGTCTYIAVLYACRGLIYFGFLFTLREYYNRFSVEGKKKHYQLCPVDTQHGSFIGKKKKKIGIKGNLFNLLYIYSTFSMLGVSRGFVSECLSLPWLLHYGSGSGAELRRRLGRMVDRVGRRFW